MANLKVSKKGKEFIASHEGNILKVYKDPVGLPTVGIGHLITPEEKPAYPVGKKITHAESLRFFDHDLITREVFLNSLIKVPVTQNQFDALMSLMFNIGNAAFKKSTCLRKLNARDYTGAANAMLSWNKATKNGRKVILPGLDRRRKEERTLFLTKDSKIDATTPQKEKVKAFEVSNIPVVIPTVESRQTISAPPEIIDSVINNGDTGDSLTSGAEQFMDGLREKAGSSIGQVKETVSETIHEGEKQIEKTTSEVKNTFDAKDLPAFIPRFGKQWLIGLIPGAGFITTIGSYFAGLPQWVVLIIGAIAGIALWKFLELAIKHHEKVLEFIKQCYEVTADPSKHNLIPTQAAEFVGMRKDTLEKVLGGQ